MRLKMMLGEAIRSIGANVSTTVAATMTVLIGMFLLGLFIAFATYAHSWSDHVKDELVVKVFFDRDAPAGQVEALRVKLESDGRIERIAVPRHLLEQVQEGSDQLVPLHRPT
jgi:cell division protein FtsX